MTDADIDGAHIRTLLLTFFFRQMQQLFLSDMIYIAQPPLYEIRVKGERKSEYILSEHQMRKRMITRGLEGAQLVIKNGKKRRTVSDKKLAGLVKLLADAERIIAVLARRGINFAKFIQAYYDGSQLPRFRICIESQEEIYYDKDDYEKRLVQLKRRIKVRTEAEAEESIIAEELHEVGRINQINEKLKDQFSLDLKDFLQPRDSMLNARKRRKSRVEKRETNSENRAAKFQLVDGEDRYDVASLGDICLTIRRIGGKGIDIKRFKGLGEMNAEQLWDTTMNPGTRTLLSVKLEDAGEADRLFSILMGGDVEQRRNFIRDHALEVQNLDI